jgi:hypothetical protein
MPGVPLRPLRAVTRVCGTTLAVEVRKRSSVMWPWCSTGKLSAKGSLPLGSNVSSFPPDRCRRSACGGHTPPSIGGATATGESTGGNDAGRLRGGGARNVHLFARAPTTRRRQSCGNDQRQSSSCGDWLLTARATRRTPLRAGAAAATLGGEPWQICTKRAIIGRVRTKCS